MKINANFTEKVIVHSAEMDWLKSPMPGVFRRPLDRVGGEVARATSVVRYAPDSQFSPHVHHGGEEFLVLEGVFQDEHGDFPAGSYIRNPPQSRHTPGSEHGCVILVKLWQFLPQDRIHVRLNERFMRAISDTETPGVDIVSLYHDAFEDVSIQYWSANTQLEFEFAKGAEIFVLSGGFGEGEHQLSEGSWLRLPQSGTLAATVGDAGAKVWVKQGHLDRVADEVARLPL